MTDCPEHRLRLCACLCAGSSCSFIPVCLCGLFHISGIRRLFPHVVCLRVFCLPICLFSWPARLCVGVHGQKYVRFGFYVHERAYRNVQECVCVCLCVEGCGVTGRSSSPQTRPDDEEGSAAALLWSSSLRSGTWPRAASK